MKKIFQIVIFALLAFSLGSLCGSDRIAVLDDLIADERGKKNPNETLIKEYETEREQILEKQAKAQGLTQKQIETARALRSGGGGGGGGRALTKEQEEVLALAEQGGVKKAIEALRQSGVSLGDVPESTTTASQVPSTLKPSVKGPLTTGGPVGKKPPPPPPPPPTTGQQTSQLSGPVVKGLPPTGASQKVVAPPLKTIAFGLLQPGGDSYLFGADVRVLAINFEELFPAKTATVKGSPTPSGSVPTQVAKKVSFFPKGAPQQLISAHTYLAKKAPFAKMLTDIASITSLLPSDLDALLSFLLKISSEGAEHNKNIATFTTAGGNLATLSEPVELFIAEVLKEVTIGKKMTKLELCLKHLRVIQKKEEAKSTIAGIVKPSLIAQEFHDYIDSPEFKGTLAVMVALVNNFKKGPTTGSAEIKSINLASVSILKKCNSSAARDPLKTYLVNNLLDVAVLSLPSNPVIQLGSNFSDSNFLVKLSALEELSKFFNSVQKSPNAVDVFCSAPSSTPSTYGDDSEIKGIIDAANKALTPAKALSDKIEAKLVDLIKFFNPPGTNDDEKRLSVIKGIEEMNIDIHASFERMNKLAASAGRSLSFPMDMKDCIF